MKKMKRRCCVYEKLSCTKKMRKVQHLKHLQQQLRGGYYARCAISYK